MFVKNQQLVLMNIELKIPIQLFIKIMKFLNVVVAVNVSLITWTIRFFNLAHYHTGMLWRIHMFGSITHQLSRYHSSVSHRSVLVSQRI